MTDRAARLGGGLRRLGLTLVVNLVNLGLGAVSGVLSARALPPDDRGVMVGVVVWSTTFAALSLLGMEASVIFGAKGDYRSSLLARRLLTRFAFFQIVVGTLLAFGANLVTTRHLEIHALLVAVLGSLVVPLNALIQMNLAPMLVGRQMVRWNLLRLIPPLGFVVMSGALLAGGRFSVSTGVGSLVAANALAALAAAVLGRSRDEPPEAMDVSSKDLLRYGRQTVMLQVPTVVAQRADQFAMALFLPPKALGVYAVAAAIAAMADVVQLSLNQILFPSYVADSEGWRDSRRVAYLAVACCAAVVLVLFYPLTLVVPIVYGDEYRAANEPLLWLLLAAAVRVGTTIMTSAARAADDLRYLVMLQVGCLAGTLVLLGLLLPLAGLTGAASAVLFSQIALFCLLAGRVGNLHAEVREAQHVS